MALCVIKRKEINEERYLGNEYEEGYHYSTYTNQPATYGPTWATLDKYLGNHKTHGLTIFVSEQAAKEYIEDNQKWTKYTMEVVPLFSLENNS